jgi:PAS domain S-box-containing protein
MPLPTEAFENSLTQDGRYRLLVEAVTDYAIYMLDPAGIITSWNAGAQRLKGYTSAEILGQHFSRFYTEEYRQNGVPQRALEAALREGWFEKEGWRVRKGGERFWANVIIDPIRNDDGILIGFAKVTRDITERRNAQIELEQAREALFQSQKMDAIGQLTGGVAHDFNNLLMTIISSLEIIGKRLPDDPRITPFIDNAMQAAQRGAALTQRMLAFARRQELEAVPVDIPALVQGMSDLLRRALGPQISIELRFPLTLPRARADSNQLEMAVLNLAVNARDAMPQGGPITIEAREERVAEKTGALSPGGYVCLSVIDAGEGMDQVTLSRAIEPFFTTKEIGKGTGLGLPMVDGLAAQFGGQFILKSKPGQGTTAEIWLPVADAPVEEAELPAPPEPPPRPLVVMAVDDDALVLMNTAAMLQELGHTVIEATSGMEALERLRDGAAVDLIVTDQAMPRMTGAQLIAAVRAEQPELPIILATGYAELPVGMDVTVPRLPKPFRQRDLIAAIASAVSPH